jgi:hypothetical protein
MKQQTIVTLIALILTIGICQCFVNAQEGEGEGDTSVVVTLDKTQFTKAERCKAIKLYVGAVDDYLMATLTNEQKTELFNLLFPQVVNNTEENQAQILDDSLRQLIKNGICTKAQALAFKTTLQKE